MAVYMDAAPGGVGGHSEWGNCRVDVPACGDNGEWYYPAVSRLNNRRNETVPDHYVESVVHNPDESG